MKKFLFLSLIVLAGCGGGGSNSESNIPSKIVHVKFNNLPQELNLDAKGIIVQGTLSLSGSQQNNIDESKASEPPLVGPISASKLSDGGLSIDFGSVVEGNYSFVLEIIQQPADGLSVSLSAPITLAKATPSINIGQDPITEITIDGSTLDASLDNDKDGLTNLKEISLGTNPNSVDTDGDGVNDSVDLFPLDPKESSDIDKDGIGDNSDPDIDGDGVLNVDEILQGTNPLVADTDGDSVSDKNDNCPTIKNPDQADNDKDGMGDLCDDDDDNDGLTDQQEAILGTDPKKADTDGDGVSDKDDAFPLDRTETIDSDHDGIGNNADPDNDNDGVSNLEELRRGTDPFNRDTDGDGIPDNIDTCPLLATGNNVDTDGDGMGDECDADDDNDGILNINESKPAQAYTDPRRADTDGDSILDPVDNCPNTPNTNQLDSDGDGWGDACDCNPHNNRYYPFAHDSPEVIVDDPSTPDFNETDQNCDGIDGDRYHAIFVDGQFGNDLNLGTADSPVASLTKGVQLAQARSLTDIYVAQGVYRLDQASNNVALPNNIHLYGGYSQNFQRRDVRNTDSELRAEGTNPVFYFVGKQGIVINGFHITNGSTDSLTSTIVIENSEVNLSYNNIQGSDFEGFQSTAVTILNSPRSTLLGNSIDGGHGVASRGVYVDSSSPSLINNVITGQGRHTTCIEAVDSSPLVTNNTLIAGSTAIRVDIAEGLVLQRSSPDLVDNVILTRNGRTQTGIVIIENAPTQGIWTHNYIQTFPVRGVAPLLIDELDNFYFTVSDLGTFVSRNSQIQIESVLNNPTLGISQIVGDSYRPITGSPLIDSGINTSGETYGSVTNDFNGKARGSAYDIGAFEF